jgi:protein O-mannosyl-transferase
MSDSSFPAEPTVDREPDTAAGPLLDRSSAIPPGAGFPAPAAFFVAAFLLAVAVISVYAVGLRAPFIFDDIPCIVNNPSIRHVFPLWEERPGSGPLWPPQDFTTAGRPLVNLSLALNVATGGLSPIGFHIFNVATHWLSALLLWAIVRRTLRLEYFGGRFSWSADWLALATALVWAVHPLHTEAVEYVSQRTELLMALFYLSTIFGALRYWTATAGGPRFGWLLLTTTACLCGMACKEVTVTVPVVVLLFERTFVTRSFMKALRRSWPLYLGLAFGWVLLAMLNIHGPRAASAGFHLGVSPITWWCTEAKVLLLYLKLAIWPRPLVIHYEVPYVDTVRAAWPSVLGVGVFGILTLVLVWKNRAVGFLLASIWLVLSPTLVVPVITEVAAERRMYLPLASLCALAIVDGFTVLGRISRRFTIDGRADSRAPTVITAIGAMGVVLAFAIVSARRVMTYQDALALWQDALPQQPHNYVVHTNLGVEYINAGRFEEAIGELREAARLATMNQPKIHTELATALAKSGRHAEAAEEFREVLRLDANYFERMRVQQGLAISLINAGRLEEGVAEFERIVLEYPESADAQNNLGLALLKKGDARQAVPHFQQTVRLRPDSAQAYFNLGLALAKNHLPREAIKPLEQALRLQPNYPQIHAELGRALLDAQQPNAAIDELQRALTVDPKNGALHADIGRALAGAARWREAAVEYQQALELGDKSPGIHRLFGVALMNSSRLQYALAQFELALSADPSDAESLFDSTKIYAQLHQNEEAIAAAERALELSRKNGPESLTQQIDAWLVEIRGRQKK